MSAANLDELRQRLLFHSSLDVWRTLCRERQWDWRRAETYHRFLEHLRSGGVELRPLPQGSPVKLEGKVQPTYSIRLDERTTERVRAFPG